MKPTDNSAGVDLTSLQILDPKLKRKHDKDWFPEINKHSKWIVYARVIYALFIMF